MFNRNKTQPQIVIPRQAVRRPTPPVTVTGPDGFEPCFVRDIANDDTIAIEHPVKPGLTEMTVSRIYRSPSAIREYDDAQWIGTLTNGQKVHCSFKQQTPAWRMPSMVDTPTEDDLELAPFSITPNFTQV